MRLMKRVELHRERGGYRRHRRRWRDLFNVSTASVLWLPLASAHVAKHGNRSVSSSSGSADLFDIMASIDLKPEQVARCIEQVGVGFMTHLTHRHALCKWAGEMGVRTLFNILGPLTNPASAPNQVLGVYSAS